MGDRRLKRCPVLRLGSAAAGLLVLCLLAFRSDFRPAAVVEGQDGIRLAVLVVFDQMRGDYLERWQGLFDGGGFRRLREEGAWFRNCHYPYANTVTAAGHASVLTGCSPWVHGIVANDWYDRATGKQLSCVASDRYERVPQAVATASVADFLGKQQPAPGAAPDRLLVPNLGDVLKEATGGRSRVISLSFKDRAAVLPAGHKPDACYWFDQAGGQFVTSTYYRSALHPWVAAFNRSGAAVRWEGKDWVPSRPSVTNSQFPPPSYLGEEIEYPAAPRDFRHRLRTRRPPSGYYQDLFNSPFGNELLLELARRAIDAEQLGRRDVPDLLCISFSSNDAIGHTWGPDSQEVLDVTLRSDHVMKELLDYLDARVGKGHYLLAVTADHGVCPMPEVVRGKEAGRLAPQLLTLSASLFLSGRLGPGRWLENASYPWIYLDHGQMKRHGVGEEQIEEDLARWLSAQPGILAAYPRAQLVHGPARDDAMAERVRRSFYPGRSGDVAVVQKPFFLLAAPLSKLTNHGTPHPYDTHVPLLLYGPGIRLGVFSEAVTPQAIAAVLARGLGIRPPPAAEAPVPESLTW